MTSSLRLVRRIGHIQRAVILRRRGSAGNGTDPRALEKLVQTAIPMTRREWRLTRPATRRQSVTLALALLAISTIAVGCSTPSHEDMLATITGTLKVLPPEFPGTPQLVSGTVTLSGQNHVFTVTVGKSGRYAVRVPPGTYTVTGRSPVYGLNQMTCRAPSEVIAVLGAKAEADVDCPVA